MRHPVSARLGEDLTATVQAALAENGIINVPCIAEEIRRRHEKENIALEDVAVMVIGEAQRLGAAMEFYNSPLPAIRRTRPLQGNWRAWRGCKDPIR